MADHVYSIATHGLALQRKRSDITVGTATTQHTASFAADQATVTAAIATLVADGATPTQAHVTALNTAYTAFLADTVAGAPVELRVTDQAMTSREVYQFCEYLADLFATRDAQVIPTGTLLV